LSFNYTYDGFQEIKEQKNISLSQEIGIFKSDFIHINEDIVLYRNYFDIYKNNSMEYNFDIKGISINIALEAEFLYQSNLSKFQCIQQSNNTKICLINKEQGNVSYKASSKLKNLLIFIKEEFFIKLQQDNKKIVNIMETLQNLKLSQALKSTTTSIKTKICAYEIYNATNETKLDTIFIQSKVLELLTYELSELINETKTPTDTINYSEYDLDALHEAKKILINNMQNPPSIIELSRQVKLNEFKLKHGFKKVFNTTPYGFLLEYKLHEAKQLLESGDMNVSEVAFEIGYKQVHGFSNAFLKRFGIRPKDILKSRKYYC